MSAHSQWSRTDPVESHTRPNRKSSGLRPAPDTDAWRSVKADSEHIQFELEVRTRLARMASESRFALLGLHWSAYSRLIENTYREERHRFDPGAVPLPILVKYAADLAVYRKALDAAWMLLENDGARRAHRDWLVGPPAVAGAVDTYLDRARRALECGDRRSASDALLRTIEMDPGNAQARDLGVRLRRRVR